MRAHLCAGVGVCMHRWRTEVGSVFLSIAVHHVLEKVGLAFPGRVAGRPAR